MKQKTNIPKKNNKLVVAALVFLALLFFIIFGSIFRVMWKDAHYQENALKYDGIVYKADTPLGLVQKVVNTPTYESENGIINVLQYIYRALSVDFTTPVMSQTYCCELIRRYKEPPFYVWTENKGTKHTYEVIEKNRRQQIIAVHSDYPNTDINSEIYFTVFKADDGWRIDKYRTLPGIGQLYAYAYGQSSIEPKFIDILSQRKYPVSKDSAKLALKDDRQLIDYFNANKSAFYELNDVIEKKDITNYDKATNDLIHTLGLTDVITNYNNYCRDCRFFIIAGTDDNTVGYFYLEDKSLLPKITGQALIIIRDMGNGWYFYKGT